MKRIFRLSLGLALLSSALMYQGCTKDYGTDIAQVKQDLEALAGGEVSSLAEQAKQLESSVATLQKAKEELEKTIAELQKADGKNAADIASLQSQAAQMKSTIEALQNTINGIQKDLKDNYATQAWVKNSYATIEALANTNKLVGELNARIAALETSDANILKRIDEVNTLANAASINANKALGEIAAVRNDLATNYYKKGEIDGFIATLNSEDAAIKGQLEDAKKELNGKLETLKSEILAKITSEIAAATKDITAAYQAADDVLQKQIDTLGNKVIPAVKEEIKGIQSSMSELKTNLESQISKCNEAIGAEKAAREQAIKDAINKEIGDRDAAIAAESKKINARIDEICKEFNIKIDAVASRIVSISVLPTNEPELILVGLGENSQAILSTSFLVQPKTALKGLDTANFALCVKEGYVRTKGAAEPLDKEYGAKDFKEFKIDTLTGVVTLTAFIDKISSDEKGYYFALKATAKDEASEYSLASDFALAIEGESINLSEGDWYWTDGEKYDQSSEKDLGLKETEWTKFNTINDNRLATWSPVLKIGEKYYTAADIKAEFNIDVDVTCAEDDVIYNHDKEFGDVNPMAFNVNEEVLMNSYLSNNEKVADKDAKDYVGDVVNFGFGKILINGEEVKGISKVFGSHVLTKVINVDAKLDPIVACWNYINNVKSGKASRNYNGTDWMVAIDDKAVAANPATFDPEHRTLAQGEVFGPVEEGNNYKDSVVFVQDMAFALAEEKGFVYDTLIARIAKENTHSLYKYEIPVAVQQQPFDSVKVSKSLGDSLARITKENEFKLGNIIAETLDPDMKYYLNGLDEAVAEDVYAAFTAGIVSNVKLNGKATDATVKFAGSLVEDVFTDESNVIFPAGELVYGTNYTLTFDYSIFNVVYSFTFTFSAKTADINLVFTPYIDKDNRAEVRGFFDPAKNNVFSLHNIYTSKLMRVEGAGVEAEGMENVTVRIVKYEKEKNTSGNIKRKATIALDKIVSKDVYSLDEKNLIDWNTYTGREVKFTVQLYVGNKTVGEPKQFTLWTIKPAKFERAGEVSVTRLAAQSAVCNLFKGCVVYGAVEGEYDTKTNLVNQANGTINPKYPECKLVYDFTKMSTKINGVEFKLVEGVDYNIVDATNGIIEIIGDNVVGSVEIAVPVTLWYNLDYDHTDVETKNAIIHLNQK